MGWELRVKRGAGVVGWGREEGVVYRSLKLEADITFR